MERLYNILLTLAAAAAILTASTAKANPDPCPETGNTNERPAVTHNQETEEGLPGIPVIKTPDGTRLARDLELEEANRDSGTRPEDGLPGKPVVQTRNGTRPARDLTTETNGSTHCPCPETDHRDRSKTAERDRKHTANRASSLLGQPRKVYPLPDNTRTEDNELADRGQLMDSLKDAAKRNKKQDKDNGKAATNTTLGKTLNLAGIDPKRLDGAKTEHTDTGSTKITLSDGTVIWTGPDKDGYGSSVTKPDGDQVEVYPDGTVSRTNAKDPKSDTVTTRPDGTVIVHDGKKDTLTITDKYSHTFTRPMTFFKKINRSDMTYDDLMDMLFPDRTKGKKTGNTTLDGALHRAGLSRKDLNNVSKVEPSTFDKAVKITLKDGTVIWTGPDSDGDGSSVTKPNGDQIETYPDGTVSTRKGLNGHTVTKRPNGITTDYDPDDDTMTATDKQGHKITQNMKYWNNWFKTGHDVKDLLDTYNHE